MRVERRIGNRSPHVHLRREMNDDLGPRFLDYRRNRGGVAKIGLMKSSLRVYLMALAGGEIIQH